MLVADPDRADQLCDGAIDTAAANAAGALLCSHCEKPLPGANLSVCPHCGYYAALGMCIDLDESWERLASGGSSPSAEAAASPQLKTHLQVWIELVPPWAWLLLACNAAVLVLSAFARIAVPSGSMRTLWSVTQLVAGFGTLATCHLIAYLAAIADDATLNILDILLKPIKIWKGIFSSLPKSLRLATGGSCGLSAVVGSVLIIGALPYSMLLDWGIKPPPQQNLVGAIVAQAQKVEGNEDGLEEAINDFAGEAGDIDANGLAPKEPEKNVRVDCVILGYTIDSNDSSEITSLVIAREFQGQLKFIGRLTEGLSDEVRFDLSEDLAEIPRREPFVSLPTHVEARWVQPKYLCRVKCVRETQSGSLVDMEFDSLLGAIR